MKQTSKNDIETITVDISCLEVLHGVVSGERAAIAKIYVKYSNDLLEIASKKIPQSLKQKIDAESIVHSLIVGLMDNSRIIENISEYEIKNWNQLFALLAKMTVNRALNRYRFFHSKKRDISQEFSIDTITKALSAVAPEEYAHYADLIEKLQQEFTDEQWQVVELKLETQSIRDIARITNKTTTYVRTVLDKLKEKLRELLSDNSLILQIKERE